MGRQSVWLSLVFVLVAGCAQLQTKVPEDVEFDLSGRLAARYGKDGFTGNIAWRHAKSADEMLITSTLGAGVARIVRDGDSVVLPTAEPRETSTLGAGVARIVRDGDSVVLTTAEPREYRARDAEA